jgi:hypothetical protein
VVVLPNVERIPLETMRKLEEFAGNGGVVIATRRLPGIVPGMKATAAEQTELKNIVQGLFEGAFAKGHFVADEKEQFKNRLTRVSEPDMSLSPSVADIGFVHRRTSDSEIYFIANTSNVRQAVKASFRVKDMRAEWWDLFRGYVGTAKVEATSDFTMSVALDLEPYGSRVLVFTKRKLPASAPWTGASATQPIDLSTGWRVTFGSTTTPVMMDQLRSWTDDESTRYFSGTATYEKDVMVPESFLPPGTAVRLDFGEGKPLAEQNLRAGMQAWLDSPVREAAVVYVNEKRAGSVWCPPYSVDLTNILRPGNNKIRIVVANTAINYMSGRKLPDYRLLNLRYGERFQAQDMDKVQAVPSGLFGPIRLVTHLEEVNTARR